MTRWAMQLPPGVHNDLPVVASMLTKHAEADGWRVTGKPKVQRHDPVNFGTDEDPLYIDDDPTPAWTVEAEVEPLPLPTFIPSSDAVEAAARSLAREVAPNHEWDDVPVGARNYWMRSILPALVAAGTHLVADALDHLAEHGHCYQVGATTETLAATASAVRTRLEQEGSQEGEGQAGGG